MRLESGTRLGVYEIVEPIGAGGMDSPRPSVPMMMRHLAWWKLDSKEGEEVA
jgi:hypothetical protein